MVQSYTNSIFKNISTAENILNIKVAEKMAFLNH
jgi:hypothetical protein